MKEEMKTELIEFFEDVLSSGTFTDNMRKNALDLYEEIKHPSCNTIIVDFNNTIEYPYSSGNIPSSFDKEEIQRFRTESIDDSGVLSIIKFIRLMRIEYSCGLKEGKTFADWLESEGKLVWRRTIENQPTL